MKVDETLIGAAIAWLAFGLVAMLIANYAASASLGAAGSLALTIAFPATGFAGLLYRFFPFMKQSKAAKPQLALLQAGLVFWSIGSFAGAASGNQDAANFGHLLTAAAVLLLAVIWWQGRAPQA